MVEHGPVIGAWKRSVNDRVRKRSRFRESPRKTLRRDAHGVFASVAAKLPVVEGRGARRVNAGYGEMMQRPSRYLGEIPKALIEEWQIRGAD